MFGGVALAEPEEPADDWVTPDWPVLMAEGMGPTGEALNLLAGVDPAGLSEEARVSALAQLTGIAAHCEAVRARFAAAVAGPKPADPREDWGVHEVSVASRCSVYAADREVALARQLAGRLTATFAALEAGRISYPQARLLSEETAHLTDEIAWQVEANMLRYAYRQDLTRFKVALRRWLAKLDPAFAERARRARAEVEVAHTANDDGTGDLWVRGPLEFTAAIDTALGAYAAHHKTAQGETTAQRKLNGLVEWAESYLTSPDTPRRHTRAYQVALCIDPPTMLGLANHPAEIPGYGMVPADAALHLLADGSPIRRLVVDERDGHLLDYGTTTYVVPPALAEHLIALHQTSAAPHSAVPAEGCDYDHNVPFGPHGGTTDPHNVTPLDRRWHRAKTHAGWTYLKNNDGTVDWTSPLGQRLRTDPHDYRLGP